MSISGCETYAIFTNQENYGYFSSDGWNVDKLSQTVSESLTVTLYLLKLFSVFLDQLNEQSYVLSTPRLLTSKHDILY